MEAMQKGIQAIQQNNLEEAAKWFTQAIEEEPENPIGYINFGNLLANLNDKERAERFYQKAITLDETAATAYYGLANLYYEENRFEEACKLYEKAIQHQIESADAYYMLGKSFEMLSQPKLALPYFQRAVELDPENDQNQLAFGITLASFEMFDEAKVIFTQLVERSPKLADAHYNLGVLYAVSTEEIDLASHHLKEAYTIDPNHDVAREVHAMIQQRLQ